MFITGNKNNLCTSEGYIFIEPFQINLWSEIEKDIYLKYIQVRDLINIKVQYM